MKKSLSKVSILGMAIDDISFEEALQKILGFSQDPKGCHYVVTVNSEFVILAQKDRQFLKILKNADLALADGMGVVVSKLFFGGKIHHRIAGVELLDHLCQRAAERAITVGFLGGFGNVAKRLAERQKKKYPGLKVIFAEPGDWTRGFDLRLRKQLTFCGRIGILFVAFGMGRQEFWIWRNRNFIDVGVLIGVGGAFDYLSGLKRRAPKFLQKTGLEWLWRLLFEPWRIWRMRVLPIFALVVFNEWILIKIRSLFKSYNTKKTG